MINLRTIMLAFSLSVISAAAFAADPAILVGKWIEKFQNGNGMVAEFTPTTITNYSVDASGKRTSPSQPQDVTYRDLGETIGIDFKTGGGIMVLVKDKNSITLDFPGVGTHQLVRWTAP